MGRAYDTGRQIGRDLVGSCETLTDKLCGINLDEEIMDDRDFCLGLDETAMCCEMCGWWFDPEEEGKDGTCEGCLGGEDDYDGS